MLTEVILTLLLLYFIYKTTARPSNFPPGPFNLPVVGYLPFLTDRVSNKFAELSKKYGDVFSIQMGSYRVVVLCSVKAIKDAFKEDALTGRPQFPSFVAMAEGRGLSFGQGPSWQELRQFVMKKLRDFGFGKSSLEGIIQTEIRELIANLKKTEGQPIYLKNKFHMAVVNALWTIVAGKRFQHDDSEATKTIQNISDWLNETEEGSISEFVPWMARLGFSARFLSRCRRNKQAVNAISKEVIEEHLKNFSSEEENCLAQAFLNRIQNETNPSSAFYKDEGMKNLMAVLSDMFTEGSESTSCTLQWFSLLMSTYPEIQKKVQQEMDSVLSAGELPSIHHRARLPYTEAVVMETLRFRYLAPIGFWHTAVKDFKLMGYDIPKGTLFVPNIQQLFQDPKYWEKPMEFYPEHFLNKDGSLKMPEVFIPFSIGKRNCVGEPLARMQLFLFGASLLQHFNFQLPPGEPKPSLEPTASIMLYPKPFQVILTSRKRL